MFVVLPLLIKKISLAVLVKQIWWWWISQFCFSGKTLISLISVDKLLLMHSFFFSLTTVKLLSHHLLLCKVSAEKSDIALWRNPCREYTLSCCFKVSVFVFHFESLITHLVEMFFRLNLTGNLLGCHSHMFISLFILGALLVILFFSKDPIYVLVTFHITGTQHPIPRS